jgi:bifunctional DNA-binding transcriptional regulator/antitoxin component of YhaV-PrlF toxin-antitoxin module
MQTTIPSKFQVFIPKQTRERLNLKHEQKLIKRDAGEDKALLAIGYMKNAVMVLPDETLLTKAADLSLELHLVMADAMVYAAAVTHNCPLYTSDTDLKGLPLVGYLSRQNQCRFLKKKLLGG